MNETDEDFFLMANLFPADTGLPMVVRVSIALREGCRARAA
ncbi:MAG TPA: hypothetical protein VMF05_00435 [Stellaceae bacterium]|nr:hypothetical protein [Stellaceae bacterium]